MIREITTVYMNAILLRKLGTYLPGCICTLKSAIKAHGVPWSLMELCKEVAYQQAKCGGETARI